MHRVEFWICRCSLSKFMNKQFLNVPLHVLCTFLVLVIIRGLAYIWKVQFKNCLCDSQAFGVCLSTTVLNFAVLRGELRIVFQVFGVCLSIFGLFGSQGRAVLRLSSV